MRPNNPRLLLLLMLLPALAACAAAPAPPPSAEVADVHRLAAAEHALSMLGRPYRYGGYTPAGFDCSGLVHYSFQRAGLALPRDTRALRSVGADVDWRRLSRGDLVFFDQEGKKSSHVGIYLGAGEFVHAPSSGGKVRVDRIDAPYWRRHFSQARRL